MVRTLPPLDYWKQKSKLLQLVVEEEQLTKAIQSLTTRRNAVFLELQVDSGPQIKFNDDEFTIEVSE